MRRRAFGRAVFSAAGLVVMVALGGSAFAGDVTGRDRAGDVKLAGLTKAERDALDVVSVRAIGDEAFGVMVVATFKGNVEKALGRGHLRNGLVAMILHPKSAAQKPAGLVTRGPAPGRTLRKTRSEDVGVVRQGSTIAFVVAGPGYSNVGRVEVKTFATFVLGSARSTSGTAPVISDADFDRLLVNPEYRDTVRTAVDSAALNCPELSRLKAIIERYLRFTAAALRVSPGSRYLIDLREFLDNQLVKAEVRLKLPPCTGPVTPTPPSDFSVVAKPSWYHPTPGQAPSYFCDFISTDPPQAGASVSDEITRPDGTKVTQTAMTGGDGKATIVLPIDRTGGYSERIAVSKGGVTKTATASLDVPSSPQAGPNGQCPTG